MKREKYSRLEFLKTNSLAGLGAVFTIGVLGGCESDNAQYANMQIDSIGGLSLEQLRKRYRTALFDQFLPNMEKYVIDHKYGGFMCAVDIRTGDQLSTDKRAWYEGRGMWVYSFLYNNFDQDPHYLEVARKSKDFILSHRPSGKEFWPGSFSREGKPLSGPGDIFCNLYIAEGLAEYAKAAGEDKYFKQAKKIIIDALACYDQPDYSYSSESQGSRLLNHWMVFLYSATQMLQQKPDPEIEELADRCVNAIMNHHLDSDHGLLNTRLDHDFSFIDNEKSQTINIGIGIQTLWMVMYEAQRRGDIELLDKSKDAYKKHVKSAQDVIYGGYFYLLNHVDNYTWSLIKKLSFQEEVLIGNLFLVEHTGDAWARRILAETEAYVQEKFARPDYKFWIPNGDRTVSDYNTNHVEHYHHPRYLMLNLLAVERMIHNSGMN